MQVLVLLFVLGWKCLAFPKVRQSLMQGNVEGEICLGRLFSISVPHTSYTHAASLILTKAKWRVTILVYRRGNGGTEPGKQQSNDWTSGWPDTTTPIRQCAPLLAPYPELCSRPEVRPMDINLWLWSPQQIKLLPWRGRKLYYHGSTLTVQASCLGQVRGDHHYRMGT